MVQRYRPDELEMIGMHPESDGDYVDYADYIALERELDELKADNALLRKRLEPIQELVTYINSCKYLSEHDWQERAYDAIKKCMELKEGR